MDSKVNDAEKDGGIDLKKEKKTSDGGIDSKAVNESIPTTADLSQSTTEAESLEKEKKVQHLRDLAAKARADRIASGLCKPLTEAQRKARAELLRAVKASGFSDRKLFEGVDTNPLYN